MTDVLMRTVTVAPGSPYTDDVYKSTKARGLGGKAFNWTLQSREKKKRKKKCQRHDPKINS